MPNYTGNWKVTVYHWDNPNLNELVKHEGEIKDPA
jgi:hypothetical protein